MGGDNSIRGWGYVLLRCVHMQQYTNGLTKSNLSNESYLVHFNSEDYEQLEFLDTDPSPLNTGQQK